MLTDFSGNPILASSQGPCVDLEMKKELFKLKIEVEILKHDFSILKESSIVDLKRLYGNKDSNENS